MNTEEEGKFRVRLRVIICINKGMNVRLDL